MTTCQVSQRITIRTSVAASDWDSFVASHQQASVYHLARWTQAIRECYGHLSFLLAAYDGDTIIGELPLTLVASRLFGTFLVSVPFANYGGIISSSPDAITELQQAAITLARDLRADHVELRQGKPLSSDWSSASAKVAMIVPLPGNSQALLAQFGSRLRNKVRNAEKSGLRAVWGGAELFPDFYRVFAENMRNLGTPVYPRRWFEIVLRHVTADLLVLYDGARPAAATVFLPWRYRVELPWIASTAESRKKSSTVLLYWLAMQRAIERGATALDLGRCTPGGGTYEFKRQWGPIEEPLHWYYWSREGRPIPQLRPDNPKYNLAIRAWKHLPLSLANAIGPHIVRSIP